VSLAHAFCVAFVPVVAVFAVALGVSLVPVVAFVFRVPRVRDFPMVLVICSAPVSRNCICLVAVIGSPRLAARVFFFLVRFVVNP
jgi:hypothetical protein